MHGLFWLTITRERVMAIKVQIRLFFALFFAGIFCLTNASSLGVTLDQKKEVDKFLTYIKQDEEPEKSFCKICDAILIGFWPNSAREKFDETMLRYSLSVLRRACRNRAHVLENILNLEIENLKKSIKAQERQDRAFLIKEEREYFARGGNPQDSDFVRMKKKYPMLFQIVDIYNYCDDAFLDLAKHKIVKSRTDSVAIFKYLDAQIAKDGSCAKEDKSNSSGAARHDFLVNTILQEFPQEMSFRIEQARFEQKIIFQKREIEKEGVLQYASLCQQEQLLKKRALSKQKKCEKKAQEDFLRVNFLSWMLLAKAKLDQRTKLEKFDESIKESYLKNVWSRWTGAITLKKKRLFEQDVVIPNKNHQKQIALQREERSSLPDSIDSQGCISVLNLQEQQLVNDHQKLLGAFQKKEANRLERIRRRDNQRSLKEAFSSNTKHQHKVVLKKMARDADERLLKNGFSSWEKFTSLQKKASDVMCSSNDKITDSLSKACHADLQVGEPTDFWRHDPYYLGKKYC